VYKYLFFLDPNGSFPIRCVAGSVLKKKGNISLQIILTSSSHRLLNISSGLTLLFRPALLHLPVKQNSLLVSLFNILQLKFLISSRLLLKKLHNGILDMHKCTKFYKNKWCGLPWHKHPSHTRRGNNASQPKPSDADKSPWIAGSFSSAGVWRVRAGVTGSITVLLINSQNKWHSFHLRGLSYDTSTVSSIASSPQCGV
jgi:hypothetical protein